EVSLAAVRVETISTQMGDVIDSNKMTTEPLNGRSYIDLLGLQPGVAPSRSQSGRVSGNLSGGNLSVGGQRENANGFMVNGGLVEEQVNNGTAVIPNLDSIAEFRLLTNVFDAEYGHYSGGLVNVITKSGANQLHGAAFEFFRNQKLDANNYFNNLNHVARGKYDRNQAGGTLGGPIERDHMFFFVDYQGTRQKIGTPQTTIVPSDAQRAGDLSAIADSLTDSVKGTAWAQVLSRRLGYPVAAAEPYYVPGCTSSANCVFPNARIPTSAFAPPVAPLLKLLPGANGALEGLPAYSTSAFNNTLRDNKWSVRGDANTRVGMISGYYFFDQSLVDNPYPSANVPGFNSDTWLRAQQLNLSDMKAFGTAMVNEFRFNYLRNSTLRDRYTGGIGVSLASLGFVTGPDTLGIVGVIPGLDSVPNISTHNWTIGTPQGQTGIYNSVLQWLDNVSLLRGNHTVKLGGEFHYSKIDERNTYAPNGSFEFDGSETGSDFADFLIGAPSTYIQATQQLLDSRTVYVGTYAQDSWRVNPTLTLNYGLRWEVSPFWWDTENKIQTIVPGLQSTVYPGAPRGWVFPGDPGIPKTLAPTHYDNFAPRVGFAYSPDVKGGPLGALVGGAGHPAFMDRGA
ncbi:MAG: TonB-dependent receptor, partial [Acidobacteria bacterium]